jgi:tetratricopeptide (TPR) repeat protein
MTVDRTIVTPSSAQTVGELHTRAVAKAAAGDHKSALELFDRVLTLDPGGQWEPSALLGAAIAADESSAQQGERQRALDYLDRLIHQYPSSPQYQQGLLRTMRLAGYLERWGLAAEAASAALVGPPLTPSHQVLALGVRGLAVLQQGSAAEAEPDIARAIDAAHSTAEELPDQIPTDWAPAFFASGEARRLRAEGITFLPLPPNFGAALEARAQLLLDAQRDYSVVLRARDAHWSTMAGVRIGEMYESLHTALMAAPVPAAANTAERRALFEAAMRLRYAVLLKKASALVEHTLTMVARTGESGPWVARATVARARLAEAMVAEDRALSRTPWSREVVEEALRMITSGRPFSVPVKARGTVTTSQQGTRAAGEGPGKP